MNRTSAPLLRLNGVTRSYGRLRALHQVSFQVQEGECIALFGANGAGKTTLLRILSTLLTPTSGKIFHRGASVQGQVRAAYRQTIGLMGHTSFLYDELSARENLILHARLRSVTAPGRRADELLERVGLAERRDDRVSRFSRGMEQRLSLARALISSPDLLLLDEPFSGLDDTGSGILRDILLAHRQAGGTTILVSHDLPLGVMVADSYVLLDKGAVRTEAATVPWRAVAPHKISLAGLETGPQ